MRLAVAFFLLLPAGLAQVLTVRETAGLRRFGYPVRATIEGLSAGPHVLIEDGKPVPAQFTTRGSGAVEIDFTVSLGPHESREYRVAKGISPPPRDGMKCEETADSLIARQPGGLAYVVPKDLAGLLKEVGAPNLAYLTPGSPGLAATYRDGVKRPVFRPAKAQIYKDGAFACGFRFESPSGLVEMEVPRTKSWVEVRWSATDPEDRIAGLSAAVRLAVEPPRTLVDFGAGSYVYIALRPGEDARLLAAAGRWRIDAGGHPYAAGQAPSVEGWAHVMDATRATAVAVEEFGRGSADDEILVQADGKLVIRRNGLTGTRKSLQFWLHFVAMPVQVGAATSPQSMMAPLAVSWK